MIVPAHHLSESDETLRASFRRWLRKNTPKAAERARWRSLAPDVSWASRMRWHQVLYKGGWLGLSWPKRYGGRDRSPLSDYLLCEELALAGAPFGMNLAIQIIGPILLEHGSEAQKRRYLPGILSAEDVWCIGVSEPGVGSNILAAETTAITDGGDLIVSGRKKWIRRAQRAGLCLLLARTNPGAAKELGISFLILDMHASGVSVRPIMPLTGLAEPDFNEISLDEVRVPRENLLGQINGGWPVLMTALAHEWFPIEEAAVRLEELERLTELIKARPQKRQNNEIRQKFAQIALETEALRRMARKIFGSPQPASRRMVASSLMKLSSSELSQKCAELALDLKGREALETGFPQSPAAQDPVLFRYLFSRCATIARGTSEIHRNIISWQALGLPR